MRRQEYFPNKRRRQNLKKDLNEVEMTYLPDKKFKVMVIKMFSKVGRMVET